MRNFIHSIFVVLALASAVSFSAQTPQSASGAPSTPAAPSAPAAPALPAVDEIVSKHVEALGGKDAINKVKSVYMESTISMMGADNPSTTTIVDGVGFKSEMEFNGTKIVQTFTDKGGWIINPMTGGTAATPMPDRLILSPAERK